MKDNQPFTFAPIALIVAEQGGGKSTIATARAVDDTFAHVTRVRLESGYEVKASPALNDKGKPIIGYVTVHFPDKESFVAEVPEGACVIADSVRVFANYHLYGIRYVPCDLATILEYINTGLIVDGWILIDEAYIGGDSRNSMNLLNQIITKFGMQIRKRRLDLIVCYPLDKMADLRFRLIRTERITCHYDEKTQEITAEIKRGKEKKKTITFWAPLYWPYFNTEERFAIPEKQISKALREVY